MRTAVLGQGIMALLLCAGTLDSIAQKRNANVLFTHNWLVFGEAQALPTADSIIVGGTASLSDTSSQLKVYLGSDPATFEWQIYDGEHNPLPGLPADFLSGQSGYTTRQLFIPKPGSPDSAYLVYTDRYTTSPPHLYRLGVASVGLGGPGELASGVHPTLNFVSTDVAACFMAVPHANGQDYWIVVQPIGTNAFHAHRVSALGIDPLPVVSASGPLRPIDWPTGLWLPSTEGDRFGYTQRRTSGSLLGDTLATELFAFDNASGAASHLMTLPSKRSQGMEFSATGRYLYVMENKRLYPDPGVEVSLVQYDMDAAEVPASRNVVHSYESNQVYQTMRVQLLRGIDGRIYCTHEDYPPVLGVITEPEQPGPLCGYIHEGFACVTNQAVGFYPPMKRYHDSPAIITALPENSTGGSLEVAPQPLTGIGSISHPSLRGTLRLEWFDAMGRVTRSETVQGDGGRAVIDVSTLAPGSYLLRVSSQLKAPLIERVLVAY